MLGKLAVRNTKRNVKDYFIYLITITISFSLILAYNLVAGSDEVVKLSSSMGTFKNVLTFVNIIIIFVVCFLINYTTKFMFEKRSKEFGTYMLLGIKKKKVARLLVIENILIGFVALALSIPIGFLFSQFVSLIIVKLLDIPKVLFISLDPVSIGLLAIYFLVIYLLVLLNLLRKINKMTVHDFLYFDKQNEKKMFRSNKKRNIIFVLSVILGIASLLLWHSRCNVDTFGQQETLTYLITAVAMLIISIYGISATFADIMLAILLKSKKVKYKKDNLFVIRTFASKARTMSFTFGTLSMLILLSLLCLNFSSINKGVYRSSIEENAPYDVDVVDFEQPFEDFNEYIQVVDEDYTIKETIEYPIYKEPQHQIQDYYNPEFYEHDPVMKLSDYNKLLKLRNMDTMELKDDEYCIVTRNQLVHKIEGNEAIQTIQFAGKDLHLKGFETQSFWSTMTTMGRFVVIVPDEYVQNLEISEQHLIIDTKEETTPKLEKKIEKKLAAKWVKDDSFVPLKTAPKVNELKLMSIEPDQETLAEKDRQEKLLEIPGVKISDITVREYPLGEAAAHLVGYVQNVTAEDLEEHAGEGYTSNSVIGKSGMEGLFEKELKGQNGCAISIVDSNGNKKKIIVSTIVENGKDIKLTIDSNLQKELYEQFKDDKSCSVAMNQYTGEVLALVHLHMITTILLGACQVKSGMR